MIACVMDRIIILLLCFSLVAAKIKINHLDVPESIQYGSQDDVVLDCDFDAGGEPVVEIKWFLDGLDQQIYQWLPETNKSGQAIGRLKHNIDVSYKATNDRKTMYRALHLVNLTPDISGNYSCKVSGYQSEDVETKRMIIYDVPDDGIEITVNAPEISCSAGGILPEPKMVVYIDNEQTSDNETLVSAELDDDGSYYNITAMVFLDPDRVNNSFSFTCKLSIPGTDYSITANLTVELEESAESQLEQLEEEYIESLNLTSSTERFDEGSEENTNSVDAEIETQIEEEIDSNATTTAETWTNKFDINDEMKAEQDNLEENDAASNHLLGVHLLFTVLSLALLL